jgi:hypothetical protein
MCRELADQRRFIVRLGVRLQHGVVERFVFGLELREGHV